jgi:3-dehydroquinate dehydratase type I
MICLSIQNREQLSAVESREVKYVELRFDLLKESPAQIIPFLDKELKIIATCRPGDLSEEDRIGILMDSIKLGVSFVDVEIETDEHMISALKDLTLQHKSEVIISWHDFNSTPDKAILVSILESCYRKGGDIAKIASMVNSREDMLRLLSLYSEPGRKVIIGMGEMAGITRIAAPFLGAEFTFASSGKSEETAPGQLTVEELLTIYKIVKPS